jgi:long-subunit acyl-CoA synthetase (AMP-forming)
MTSFYANRVCLWQSLGSPKGDFLLSYANQALRLLSEGRSVVFKPEEPVEKSKNVDCITLGFFTGGTSGDPELVTHSQETLGYAVSGLVDRIGPSPLDSVCCLPLWHGPRKDRLFFVITGIYSKKKIEIFFWESGYLWCLPSCMNY